MLCVYKFVIFLIYSHLGHISPIIAYKYRYFFRKTKKYGNGQQLPKLSFLLFSLSNLKQKNSFSYAKMFYLAYRDNKVSRRRVIFEHYAMRQKEHLTQT